MSELPPLDTEGAAAPPRSNGELLFAAPWESRAFGMTVALHRQGLFSWDEFRALLIAEIGRAERDAATGAEFGYYSCWLAALERLLDDKGICSAAEQSEREARLAARPHGHDH